MELGVKHMDRENGRERREGGFGGGKRFGNGGGFSSTRSSSGGMGGPRFSPVKVGEELDVSIEAVGEKGDGIAKKNGFVLFVPNVKQGDNVRIRITKVFKKVGFAEVIGEAAPRPEGEAAPAAPQEESASEEEEEESTQDTEDF